MLNFSLKKNMLLGAVDSKRVSSELNSQPDVLPGPDLMWLILTFMNKKYTSSMIVVLSPRDQRWFVM